MRILLLGNTGQLGWELHRSAITLGEVFAIDYPELDLMKVAALQKLIEAYQPQLILNATAYTAVDQAESEIEIANTINREAVAVMAEQARRLNAVLVHFSTDYVFDGLKGEPYRETDSPNPLNVYGASKLAGEQVIQEIGCTHLIFRTSWVYSLRKPSFVTKVLEWARQKPSLRVVDDQIGNPTWCRALAEASVQVLAMAKQQPPEWLFQKSGLYHLAGDGHASRLEWAQEIIKQDPHRHDQVVRELMPASTNEFPAPATRPAFSALDCQLFTNTFGIKLPDWRAALELALVNG